MNAYTEIIKAIESPKAAAVVTSGNRKEDLKKIGEKQLMADLLLVSKDGDTLCKAGINLTSSGRVNAFVLGYFLQYHPWASAYIGVTPEEGAYLLDTYNKVIAIATRVFNNAPVVTKQTLTQKLYAYVNNSL